MLDWLFTLIVFGLVFYLLREHLTDLPKLKKSQPKNQP